MSATPFDPAPLLTIARPFEPERVTTAQRRAGRVLSGLAVAFLAMNTTLSLLTLSAAVEGTRQLGFDPALVRPFGFVQLALLILYLVPRTAPLGAVLWTGWLGGAIATHVRLGNPLFSHTLFPLYIAVPLWLGLWLRDPRVRAALGPAR